MEKMDGLNISESSSSSSSPQSSSDSDSAMEDEIIKSGSEKSLKQEGVKSRSMPVIMSATENEEPAGTVNVQPSAPSVLSPEASDIALTY